MVPGATLPSLAECRECHDPIRFVRMTDTGRHMPVNPKPLTGPDLHIAGTVAARLSGHKLVGHVTSPTRSSDGHPYRFRPHYATCSEQKRAKSTTHTTAAETPLF